jgi:hypothetical protein
MTETELLRKLIEDLLEEECRCGRKPRLSEELRKRCKELGVDV